MPSPDYLFKRGDGSGTIECYGTLEPDSNFEVVCKNEADYFVHCDGNPHTHEGYFYEWAQACRYFETIAGSPIRKISAI